MCNGVIRSASLPGRWWNKKATSRFLDVEKASHCHRGSDEDVVKVRFSRDDGVALALNYVEIRRKERFLSSYEKRSVRTRALVVSMRSGKMQSSVQSMGGPQ